MDFSSTSRGSVRVEEEGGGIRKRGEKRMQRCLSNTLGHFWYSSGPEEEINALSFAFFFIFFFAIHLDLILSIFSVQNLCFQIHKYVHANLIF